MTRSCRYSTVNSTCLHDQFGTIALYIECREVSNKIYNSYNFQFSRNGFCKERLSGRRLEANIETEGILTFSFLRMQSDQPLCIILLLLYICRHIWTNELSCFIQTVGGSLISTSLGFPLTPGKPDLSTALMAFGCSVTFMSSGK